MGPGALVNRWGLVTAWATEHDDGRGGRMITADEDEPRARARFEREIARACEDGRPETFLLWSPRGKVSEVVITFERSMGWISRDGVESPIAGEW